VGKVEQLMALAHDYAGEGADSLSAAARALESALTAALADERQKVVSEVEDRLHGIDQTEAESDAGWWETSKGAKFGAGVLEAILQLKERT
jgi:hypothetical protein